MHEVVATVSDLLDCCERELARAGVYCAHGTSNWRDEAAAIVYHALGLRHEDAGAYQRLVSAAEHEHCVALVRRRIEQRIPAAYLLGEAWFAGLPFYVEPSVLVPRSPFAELIAGRFSPWLRREPRAILEIGTGSGCIAIACALAFPQAKILATDISAAALAVAQRNVARHGVGGRLQLLQADLYAGIEGRFDLIVSNPPYVPEDDLREMPAEFTWEPRSALAGGADGLDLVRPIVSGAAAHLQQEGWLAVEVGAGMAALEAAFPRTPFIWPEFALGGDGIALVAASDLPGDNVQPQRQRRGN